MDQSKDYLNLRHANPSSESIPGWSTPRLYFSASLILELFVSPISVPSRPPLTSLPGIQVLVTSFATLKVVRPPSIRLIEPAITSLTARSSSLPPTTALRFPTQQTRAQESDLFGSLTLSSNPLATIRTNPIFGSPSLQNPPPSEGMKVVEDPDAMDWTPTNPSPKKDRMNPFLRAGSAPVHPRDEREEDIVLRKQMFFPPEEPTGLEGLLGKTVLAEPPPTSSSGGGGDASGVGGWWKRRFWSANPS